VRARGLTRGELISAASALLVLVLMLAMPWYEVDGIAGRASSGARVTTSQTGWDALSGVRWLVLLTVLVAFAAATMHVARPSRQAVAGVRLALLSLGSLNAFALVVRVLIDLPSSDRVVDQKLGAVLGMLAALGVVFGASDAVREQRARLAASQR
jgi:hypothetical protein